MHGHMNVKKVSFTVFVIFTQVTHPKTLHLAYSQKQFIHYDVFFKVTSPVSLIHSSTEREVECVWNVMAHAQKPDFVFRQNGRVNLKRKGRQFSRLLAAELCASAVVILDTPRSEVVWRILATHSIRQFPLHSPPSASPCAITFQPDCTIVDLNFFNSSNRTLFFVIP